MPKIHRMKRVTRLGELAVIAVAISACAGTASRANPLAGEHHTSVAGVGQKVAQLNALAASHDGTPVDARGRKSTESVTFSRDALDQVVKTVERVRRLELGHPFFIEQITGTDFEARKRKNRGTPNQDSADLTKLLSLVPPDATRKPKRDPGRVVAYYHARSDTVVLPATTVATRDHDLATFAHEVQHALQHRHFGAAAIQKKVEDADAAWAFKALMEGDAQVTMAAYRGATHGIPLGRALRRMTDLVSGTPVHSHRGGRMVATFEGSSAGLFPYQEGASFVTDLYRTGGFALVNKAYASRPTSTMHILHPERYLAGELPAEVTLPKTGLGTMVRKGVWGELRSKGLMEQCVGAKSAATLAANWRGDAFRVSRPTGKTTPTAVTLEWVSTWTDRAAAIAAGKALRAGPCNAMTIGDGPHQSTKLIKTKGQTTYSRTRSGQEGTQTLLVAVTDKKLIFVRGAVTQDQALSALKLLANSDVQLRQRAAISTAPIPRRITVPRPGWGRIHGHRYENFWLGLNSKWPEGSRASVSKHLLSVGLPAGGLGLLTLYDHVPQGESLELIYTELKTEVGRTTGATPLEDRRVRRRIKTHLGYSLRRRYTLPNGATIVVDVVPICASTGAILVARTTSDPAAEKALNRWFADTQWIAGRNLPACRWLDPK